MKTLIKITGLLISVVIITAGCSKFDDINTNPDKPSAAKSGWFATNMLTTITQSTAMRTTGFKQPYNLSKYVLWTELQASLQYNNLDRVSFSNKFMPLKNIEPMVNNATDEGQRNGYRALGHFLRAWQFFQTTMRVGDIPYTEAIQGDKGITKPKYDLQRDVFKGILTELDEADKLFATATNIEGDFIYSGDVGKWRRLSNSFQLYVLMNLYKKTADTELNVVNKFKEVAQRPLMRDFGDNFAMTFNGSKGYCYPWSNTAADLNEFTQYTMLSTYYINLLKQDSDRRLFYVAEPSARLIASGKSASSFDAYEGVEPSNEYTSTIAAKQSGAYSDLNLRYVENGKAEPVGLFCYWDSEFVLAEAAVRGWIADAAQSHYANGIMSSMNFYARYVEAKYTHNVTLDNAYITAYPATVALTGSMEQKIKQIICQKYLAGFFHNEYQAWYEFRRTGYPEFIVNPKTNLNPTDNTKFPTRWMYPQNEIDYNTDNLKEALTRQYNGSDDHNGIMWILQ